MKRRGMSWVVVRDGTKMDQTRADSSVRSRKNMEIGPSKWQGLS